MLVTDSNRYETRTQQFDHSQYIMGSNNKIDSMRKGGRFNQSTILKYEDKSEWVFLCNNGIERFCGFLYLQNAIKDSNLKTVQAAENKIAIHDRKIIYLSRYYGDKKPDSTELLEHDNELSVLKRDIGFTDTAGNANLRKQGNAIYVFDTEKSSFDQSVHGKIDSFVQQHDVIRSALEISLQDEEVEQVAE